MRDKGRRQGEGKGKRLRDDDDDDPDFELGGGGGRRQHHHQQQQYHHQQQHHHFASAGDAAFLADPPSPDEDQQHALDAAMLAAAAAGDDGAAAFAALDPGALAALDPGVISALMATGALSCESFIGPDGQHIPVLREEDLQQLQQHLAALAAGGGDGLDFGLDPLQLAAHERAQVDGIRKGDFQAVQAAKRAGTLITLNWSLELPPELEDVDLGESRTGIIETPQSGDVPQLKRLISYSARNKLLPALQVLLTDDGLEMPDEDEDGQPMPIGALGLADGSRITLRVVIPDDVDELPLVDTAMVSSAYSSGTVVQMMHSRQTGRKTRWTQEQIEALIEGVERNGLSAWRTIVQDSRLAGKNNMQCKDKFRNLCLTIIQGRPERGLTLDWRLKDRVRQLIEHENIKF